MNDQDCRIRDLLGLASGRLREVYLHGDHSKSDPGYPEALKALCDQLDEVLASVESNKNQLTNA